MGFLETVNEKYGELSPVQKRIADYIFKYPDEVCFCSLKELANTLGVTEVTVLRFTKKIGFGSFVEMKRQLREHLQTRFIGGDTLNRVSDHIGQDGDDSDKEAMYQKFVNNELLVLKNTFEQNSVEHVLNAVSIIKQANMVYIIGNELASEASSYFTRRLLTIGIKAVDLGCVSRILYIDYLSHISPEDAVVIFSNPGYAKHIINTAAYLEQKHVPQIVITDRESSPAAAHATVTLTYDNNDLFFYNSILGFFSLASLLTYFAAMHEPAETNRLRGNLSEVREAIESGSVVKERKK